MPASSETSRAPRESRGAFSPVVLGLSLVLALSLLPSSSYAAALPLVQKEWSLTSAQAGFIFSAYQAGYVAATLLLLPLTDRVSPAWVFAASAALSTIGNALFPLWASDFVSGSILRFIAGTALVGVYMPGLRIVAELFPPERRGAPVGIYVACFYLGSNISVLLTGILLPYGWREAYLATTVISALAPIVAVLALRGRAVRPAEGGSGRLDPEVLANRPAMLAIGAYSTHTWELYAARGWIAPFLAAALLSQGFPSGEAVSTGATIAGAAFLLGTFGVPMAGFISDRFGRTLTAGFFLAGSALCSLSIGWLGAWPWWGLFGVALLYGFMIGPDSPVYSTAVTELASPGKLGSTMAVQSFSGFLASIVGPVALGAVLDVAGPTMGWGLGFAQCGVIALLGVGALALLRRHPASARLASGKR